MAANEVALYEGVQKKVADKLREQIVELIPPPLWDQMVKDVFDQFLYGAHQKRFEMDFDYKTHVHSPNLNRPKKDYNPAFDRETLPGMIMHAFQKRAMQEILTDAELEKLNPYVDYGKSKANEIILGFLKDNAPNFIAMMFYNVVQQAMFSTVESMKSQMNRDGMMYNPPPGTFKFGG